MCGIFGVVGAASAGVQQTLDALCRLESRGYDSTGIGIVQGPTDRQTSRFVVYKVADSARKLKRMLSAQPYTGESVAVIGHSRWATCGRISEENTHPHVSEYGAVMLVHNGHLDNYEELRAELQAKGISFVSETDTEVIANLLEDLLLNGKQKPMQVIQALTARLVGDYALVISFSRWPDRLFTVCRGLPLVLGFAKGAVYVASEAAAILPHTKQLVFLQGGQIAQVNAEGFIAE